MPPMSHGRRFGVTGLAFVALTLSVLSPAQPVAIAAPAASGPVTMFSDPYPSSTRNTPTSHSFRRV